MLALPTSHPLQNHGIFLDQTDDLGLGSVFTDSAPHHPKQPDDHFRLLVAKFETGQVTGPPKVASSGNRHSPKSKIVKSA